MRFIERPTPRAGSFRVIKKFLWWPLKIGEETRWLETASIKQEYYYFYGWSNSTFKDENTI